MLLLSAFFFACSAQTEMVEWISALEGIIAKTVKQLAGHLSCTAGGAAAAAAAAGTQRDGWL